MRIRPSLSNTVGGMELQRMLLLFNLLTSICPQLKRIHKRMVQKEMVAHFPR